MYKSFAPSHSSQSVEEIFYSQPEIEQEGGITNFFMSLYHGVLKYEYHRAYLRR